MTVGDGTARSHAKVSVRRTRHNATGSTMTPPTPPTTAAEPVPLAIWPCGQTPAKTQRAGRYLPAASVHPAKMLPELARRIITTYSKPGELVCDPMCGIATRSEEHTSELQSRVDLVCRLLLEKKKK